MSGMRPVGRPCTRTTPNVVAAIALVASLVFVGCGGSSTTSGSPVAGSTQPQGSPQRQTSTSAEPSPLDSIEVTVPVLLKHPLLGIPERYTCNGTGTSLPVRWSGVPSGTAELALFIINITPVDGKLYVDWAVAGLKPTANGIVAGRLPAGAVVGRNSLGNTSYTICPPKGKRETYIVKILALPRPLDAQPGFNASTLYLEAQKIVKDDGLEAAAYRGQ